MRERRKIMTGRVVSAKMTKTVIVEVEYTRQHPLYGKVMTRARRFKAHNEDPLAQLGDRVKIIESRPLSREKRWRVQEIVQRGVVVEPIAEKELESLRAKEDADRVAARADQERRAAERLAKLAGADAESDKNQESERAE
ncbi:MAG: 30S ribosomal protein S17 [Chloroflexi bacterium]|nr:30S ribosomal protein S17 [Chloroflexota bacterium]MBI3741301.1 30S ribosomal protein S17 [Chloroflexota bacterium]